MRTFGVVVYEFRQSRRTSCVVRLSQIGSHEGSDNREVVPITFLSGFEQMSELKQNAQQRHQHFSTTWPAFVWTKARKRFSKQSPLTQTSHRPFHAQKYKNNHKYQKEIRDRSTLTSCPRTFLHSECFLLQKEASYHQRCCKSKPSKWCFSVWPCSESSQTFSCIKLLQNMTEAPLNFVVRNHQTR